MVSKIALTSSTGVADGISRRMIVLRWSLKLGLIRRRAGSTTTLVLRANDLAMTLGSVVSALTFCEYLKKEDDTLKTCYLFERGRLQRTCSLYPQKSNQIATVVFIFTVALCVAFDWVEQENKMK